MALNLTRKHSTCWNDLPDELKLIILEYNFTPPKVLGAKNHQIVANIGLGPLLRTKIKKLAEIATEIFFKCSTFGITATDISKGLYLPFSGSRNIHKLELTVSRLPDALFEDDDPSAQPVRYGDDRVLNDPPIDHGAL